MWSKLTSNRDGKGRSSYNHSSKINRVAVFRRECLACREEDGSQNLRAQHFGELRGQIMKSLMTYAGALCVAVVCLLAPEASALALAPPSMKTGGFLVDCG
jgi:hypothetical protein